MSNTTQISAEEFVMEAAGVYFDEYNETFRFTATNKKVGFDWLCMAIAAVEFDICRKHYQQTKQYSDAISLNEVLTKMTFDEFVEFVEKLNDLVRKYGRNKSYGVTDYDFDRWADITGFGI